MGVGEMADERQLVWEAELDNRYRCEVRRTDDYAGELKMVDGERVLICENVGLMYGALFGPDVSDVVDWQDKCTAAADADSAP
jgi:hypothetical protein